MEQVRLERAGETKHPGGHACSPRGESGWRVGFGAETWREMRKLRWEGRWGKSWKAEGSGVPREGAQQAFQCTQACM